MNSRICIELKSLTVNHNIFYQYFYVIFCEGRIVEFDMMKIITRGEISEKRTLHFHMHGTGETVNMVNMNEDHLTNIPNNEQELNGRNYKEGERVKVGNIWNVVHINI